MNFNILRYQRLCGINFARIFVNQLKQVLNVNKLFKYQGIQYSMYMCIYVWNPWI